MRHLCGEPRENEYCHQALDQSQHENLNKARYRYILIVNYITSFNTHHQFTICLFVSFLSLVTTTVLIKISHLLLFFIFRIQRLAIRIASLAVKSLEAFNLFQGQL